MYRFDTHVHTAETSPCGNVGAARTVQLYREAGFSGLCITDHYNRSYFDAWHCADWDGTVERFLMGYRKAKEAGDACGMDILLGAELMLDGSPNEYLLFGLTEEFLFRCPALYQYSLSQVKAMTETEGMTIFQAHPFRPGLTRAEPGCLDGVEIVNGNCRHNSKNPLAARFAEENGLLVSGGSDCHETEDVGRSGIVTPRRITDHSVLNETLKTGALTVIPFESDR